VTRCILIRSDRQCASLLPLLPYYNTRIRFLMDRYFYYRMCLSGAIPLLLKQSPWPPRLIEPMSGVTCQKWGYSVLAYRVLRSLKSYLLASDSFVYPSEIISSVLTEAQTPLAVLDCNQTGAVHRKLVASVFPSNSAIRDTILE
jgi:hypothetical protein